MHHPIVTLTVNPALDVSALVPEVVAGPKLRCTDARIDPGGGGVNVSRAVAELGGQSRAIVASGGVTGAYLCDLLEAEGVAVERLPITGLTRQSFAVTETTRSEQYRFVLAGPDWTAEDGDRLRRLVAANLTPDAKLIVSGSLPPGMGAGDLMALNEQARAAGAEMILDTSGAPLVETVTKTTAPIHLLRVDGAEADELAGHPIRSVAEMADLGREIIASGRASHAVMALGAEGTLGISAAACFFCRPPKIETVSAVGAGDSLVAAMSLALARGEGFQEAVQYGAAAAGAAVKTPATALCERAEVEALRPQIRVEPV